MNILGICAFYHDAAAALLVDGAPIAFAEEERFSRRKHTGEFPAQAIAYCLQAGGISIGDVDEVAFYFNPGLVVRSFVQDLAPLVLRHGLRAGYQRGLWTASFLREVDMLRYRIGYDGPLSWVPHHLGHAAYVYYLSHFTEAAILTIDSIGERATTTIALGNGSAITQVDAVHDPHSLGYLYGAVTQHLGFKRGDGEGTVMGLASYGDPTAFRFDDILRVESNGLFTLNFEYVARRYSWADGRRLTPAFVRRFGPARKANEPIMPRHRNLAAALQQQTEQAILALARRALRLTGSRRLCLAGGVALNSVANGRLRAELDIDDLYVAPAANDAGTALGVALHCYTRRTGRRPKVSERVFLGPEYSSSAIRHVLDLADVPYQEVDNPAQVAARLLAEGKIIGWFQGRMETGPRALGNRSILADPSVPGMKDRLNRRVKFREEFRPFAPSVLHAHQQEWFACGSRVLPYMLEVVPFLPGKAERVSAVAHVDGTGRVQSVRDVDNALFHSTLTEFAGVSGIPLVLNTSFNVKGEPIVCSPADALRCFFSTGLDALVMGPFVLEKKGRSEEVTSV